MTFSGTVSNIVLIAALCGALAVIGGAIRWAWRLGSVVSEGVETLSSIAKEFKPNDGKSLKDILNRQEAIIEKMGITMHTHELVVDSERRELIARMALLEASTKEATEGARAAAKITAELLHKHDAWMSSQRPERAGDRE